MLDVQNNLHSLRYKSQNNHSHIQFYILPHKKSNPERKYRYIRPYSYHCTS